MKLSRYMIFYILWDEYASTIEELVTDITFRAFEEEEVEVITPDMVRYPSESELIAEFWATLLICTWYSSFDERKFIFLMVRVIELEVFKSEKT